MKHFGGDVLNVRNSAQIYFKSSLKKKKQGNMYVIEYYNELLRLWQELDAFQEFNQSYAINSAKYKKVLDKERVFDFLCGLNNDLDEVK